MALKLKYCALTIALFVALTFCFERPAYGYVDPGSSLLIFQSLSAIVTGTIFYFRRRLKSLFTRSSADPTDASGKSH
ncbi:MAG: hypothetical protein ABI158_03510 [Edaphobacter sp.]